MGCGGVHGEREKEASGFAYAYASFSVWWDLPIRYPVLRSDETYVPMVLSSLDYLFLFSDLNRKGTL